MSDKMPRDNRDNRDNRATKEDRMRVKISQKQASKEDKLKATTSVFTATKGSSTRTSGIHGFGGYNDGYSERYSEDFDWDRRPKKPFKPIEIQKKSPPSKTNKKNLNPPAMQHPREFDYGNIDVASIEASAADSDINYPDEPHKPKVELLKCLNVPAICIQNTMGKTLGIHDSKHSRKGRLKDASCFYYAPGQSNASKDKAVQTDALYDPDDFYEANVRSRSVSARRTTERTRDRHDENDEQDRRKAAERRSRSMGARKGAEYCG